MGRRRKEKSETLIPQPIGEVAEEVSESKGFFACYLLCSLSPRFKGHTYIGFTNNPQRRIRQHNGEIKCGASRTKWRRPWEMILCIHGFPSNVSALQFEWAWQHPTKSLAVRKAASVFKSLSGAANKIKLAYTMLTLPAWENLNLTVNFFSTKYIKLTACCPRLPKQMRVSICAMEELPCYLNGDDEDEDCDMSGSEDMLHNQREVDSLNPSGWKVSNDYREEMDSMVSNHRLPDEDNGAQKWLSCDDDRNECDRLRRPVESSDQILSQKSIDKERTSSSETQNTATALAPIDDVLGQCETDFVHPIGPMWFFCPDSSPTSNEENKRASPNEVRLNSGKEPSVWCDESHLAQLTESPTPGVNNCLRVAENLLSPNVDFIDLSTPPNCILRSCNKGALVHPRIIDLTDSPVIVQL